MNKQFLIANFQGIRAVAASLVVSSHIYLEASRVGIQVDFLSRASGFADLGVAMFFVLSGWLMGVQMGQPTVSPKRFLFRRVTRIAPLYVFVTLGVIAYQLFVTRNLDLPHWMASLLFLSQALELGHPTLYVGWTLEFEILFYMLVALSIAVAPIRIRLLAISGSLILLCITGLLPWLVSYFAIGLIVQSIPRPKKELKFFGVFLVVILMSLIMSIQLIHGAPVYHNVALYGFELGFLFYCLAGPTQTRSEWVVKLGDLSYAEYLVHVPLLTLIMAFIPNNVEPRAVALLCFLTVLTSSFLVWKYFDRPIQKRLGSRAKDA